MTTNATAKSALRLDTSAVDLEALFDSLGELVLVLDGETRIRSANAASLDALGIEPEKLIGRRLFEIVNSDEQAPFLAGLEELRTGPLPFVTMRLRAGESGHAERIFNTTTRRLDAKDGRLFVLVGRPESPMDGAEGSPQPHLRPIGRWRYDLTSSTLHWYAQTLAGNLDNPDFEAQIDDFALRLVHPDDREEYRGIVQNAIKTHQPFFARYRVVRRQGQYQWVACLGTVNLGADGVPVALSGLTYEVTHAPSDDEQIEAGAMQLHELFSQISDVVMRHDAHGHFIYVSPSVGRVLGYHPRELIGIKKAQDFTHPDDLQGVVNSIRSLNTTGASTTLTYRFLHKDGHWVWIESIVRALLIGPGGLPLETAAVARDVTVRKREEEQLTAAYARAEAASATKSRFLANMSHELRTPLNAIIGFSDIIRRELFGAIGSARYKEYAQLIHESGGHLLDLINDILDMSKIEAGKFDLRFEAIDLDDLVTSSLKLLEPRANEAKLVLDVEVGQEKPYVQADRRAIKQILLNLLTNAIKFTPPGGMVTVSLQTLSDGVALQIRDTGIGIAEKDLSRITLPFEQATHDPLLAQAGSGLGLALVQSLVNLHMGTLKIDSVPGQGTCVTVFLPADPRSRKAA